MIIKNLKINKYKSIRRSISLDFSNLNIFIGQNNCGKSNILDALQIILDKQKDKTNLFYPDADIQVQLELDKEEIKEYKADDE